MIKLVKSPEVVETLAKEFSKLIFEYIGKDKLLRVVELNKTEENDTTCHSHDFCDANVFIADAFKIYGIDPENDFGEFLQDDNCIDIWNSAWNLAKENDFYKSSLIEV